MPPKRRIAALLLLCCAELNVQYVINTFAGGGAPQGLPATSAGVGMPSNITKESLGNFYIPSAAQYRVYKVDVNVLITTIAGNGESSFSGDGGSALAASFSGFG